MEFVIWSKILFSEHFLMAASGGAGLNVNWMFIWRHGFVWSSNLHLIGSCVMFNIHKVYVSLLFFLTETDLDACGVFHVVLFDINEQLKNILWCQNNCLVSKHLNVHSMFWSLRFTCLLSFFIADIWIWEWL